MFILVIFHLKWGAFRPVIPRRRVADGGG